MRRRVVLTLATVALLCASCSETPDVVVAGSDRTAEAISATVVVTTTVPGQRPALLPTTTSLHEDAGPGAAPAEQTPALQQANGSPTTVATEVEQMPDPTPTIEDEPVSSWRDHPLARVVLTADDLPALGLDSGWEVGWIDFIELDATDHTEEEVCGAAVPAQRSYFTASFEDRVSGIQLDLNVMPATGGDEALDFLKTLENLAICPALEEEFALVSMDVVAIEVHGAAQSLVITGTDGTSPAEPVGLTLAAAEVDGHLFMAFVAQDSGTPASGDAELAAKALELSISRL